MTDIIDIIFLNSSNNVIEEINVKKPQSYFDLLSTIKIKLKKVPNNFKIFYKTDNNAEKEILNNEEYKLSKDILFIQEKKELDKSIFSSIYDKLSESNKEILDDKYNCYICSVIIKNERPLFCYICQKNFHKNCLKNWDFTRKRQNLNLSCPNCRNELPFEEWKEKLNFEENRINDGELIEKLNDYKMNSKIYEKINQIKENKLCILEDKYNKCIECKNNYLKNILLKFKKINEIIAYSNNIINESIDNFNKIQINDIFKSILQNLDILFNYINDTNTNKNNKKYLKKEENRKIENKIINNFVEENAESSEDSKYSEKSKKTEESEESEISQDLEGNYVTIIYKHARMKIPLKFIEEILFLKKKIFDAMNIHPNYQKLFLYKNNKLEKSEWEPDLDSYDTIIGFKIKEKIQLKLFLPFHFETEYGLNFTLDIFHDHKIIEIKNKIEKLYKIPNDNQIFIFDNGKLENNHKTLFKYYKINYSKPPQKPEHILIKHKYHKNIKFTIMIRDKTEKIIMDYFDTIDNLYNILSKKAGKNIDINYYVLKFGETYIYKKNEILNNYFNDSHKVSLLLIKSSMKINIYTLNKKKIILICQLWDTIENILENIEELENFDKNKYCLSFNGIILENQKNLIDYNIQNDNELNLLLK